LFATDLNVKAAVTFLALFDVRKPYGLL